MNDEDPVTQIERYKRRCDAVYAAAFVTKMFEYGVADSRSAFDASRLAENLVALVPPPPPPTNERALHVRGCRCHLCNTAPAPEDPR
jgi:hypothetical protein